MSGNNQFAPFQKRNQSFVVKNIAANKKTITIFQYPINFNGTRDLLAIPGVSESSIRASLLKGELLRKIEAEEIIILESDIDLLQFNLNQRAFLESNGVVNGTRVGFDQLSYNRKEDIQLIGAVNDINTVFKIPSGTFIQDNDHKIIVYKNGVKQFYLDDYFVAESNGVGSGYDTVIFTTPPQTIPAPDDVITADYYLI